MENILQSLYELDLKQDKDLSLKQAEGHTVREFIYTTYQYNRFRFLNSNRDISPSNQKKLLKSLKRNNVFGASTIIVKEHEDGYLYIYEGQHRYEALKELGYPIDYIINQDLEEEDISLINTASENWILKDYLKQYLSNPNGKNYESYKRFNDIWVKYGTNDDGIDVAGFNFANLLFIVYGFTGGVNKKFKEGDLIITEELYEEKIVLINTLERFLIKDGNILPDCINTRNYIRALIETLQIEGWENNDTIILEDKMRRYKEKISNKSFSEPTQYVQKISEVYNLYQKNRFMDNKTIHGGKKRIYYMSNVV
tara:strand:+ start:1088 stop:2020 length:933 start_codon:yes stop_codon:yes gene_type:complete